MPFDDIVPTETDTTGPRSNVASWYTPALSDALGDRLLMFDNTTSAPLELLRFKREFAEAPRFEAALRERVRLLAPLDLPSFAPVRTVRRLGSGEGLALVSNQTNGRRLSEVLHLARGPVLAAKLVLRLTPTLAALHDVAPGVAHGLLTPDRILVTPGGGLVLVEHVLASAVASLRLPAERLRSEFALGVPAGAVNVPFDQRLDVVELGHIALALLLGHAAATLEGADRLADIITDLAHARGNGPPVPGHLLTWIERALQIDAAPFATAREAASALEKWPDHRALLADRPHRLYGEFWQPELAVAASKGSEQDFDILVPDLTAPLEASAAFPSESRASILEKTDATVATVPESAPEQASRRWLSLERARWIIGVLAAIALVEMMFVSRMWRHQEQIEPAQATVTAPVTSPPIVEPQVPSPAASKSAQTTTPVVIPRPASPAVASGTPAVRGTVAIDDTASTSVPTGFASFTAQPWANVWIDGRSMGRTPLTNVAVPVGRHDVLWKHPELGERHQQMDVTAVAPVSLSMNMRE